MTQYEFNQLMIDTGVPISTLHICIGKNIGIPFTYGIYKDAQEWVVYYRDERSEYSERFRGSESDAYGNILRKVLAQLFDFGYINSAVTEDIILTPQRYVFQFLSEDFKMSDKLQQQTWDYLKQDFHVLNEVKYYAVNGTFVPEKYCYKVQGYSAQQLFETTYLDVIGAFNYLVYLKRKPKEALADLKAGLPRK